MKKKIKKYFKDNNLGLFLVVFVGFLVALYFLFSEGMHFYRFDVPDDSGNLDISSGMQGIGNALQAIVGIAVGFAGAWVVIMIAQNSQRTLDQEERREAIKIAIDLVKNTSMKYRQFAQKFKQLIFLMPDPMKEEDLLRVISLLRLSLLPQLGFSRANSCETNYEYPDIETEERGRRILNALILSSEQSTSEYDPTYQADLIQYVNITKIWSANILKALRITELNDSTYKRVFEYVEKLSSISDTEKIQNSISELNIALKEIEEDFECQMLASFINNKHIHSNLHSLSTESTELSKALFAESNLKNEIHQGMLVTMIRMNQWLDKIERFDKKYNTDFEDDAYSVHEVFRRQSVLSYLYSGFGRSRGSQFGGKGWFVSMESVLPNNENYLNFIRDVVAESEFTIPEFLEKAIKLIDLKLVLGERVCNVARMLDDNSTDKMLTGVAYANKDELHYDADVEWEDSITNYCGSNIFGSKSDALSNYNIAIESDTFLKKWLVMNGNE